MSTKREVNKPAKKTGFAKVVEVASHLRVSKHAIYRAIKAGQIAATMIGGSIRLKWEEVEALHKVTPL